MAQPASRSRGCVSWARPGTPISDWHRSRKPSALPESSCQGCHVVFIFPRRRRGAEKRMEISSPIPKFRRIGLGTMCGSSDSFPAPLRLRGRKGENFGPPDMNFPEEPAVGGAAAAGKFAGRRADGSPLQGSGIVGGADPGRRAPAACLPWAIIGWPFRPRLRLSLA